MPRKSSRVLQGSARDRLLRAAATLLDESGDGTLSTRAVCALAGVQAPTLYHHFGSKQGLIDAVMRHGFGQYVGEAPSAGTDDPIDAVRRGWDRHVAYGLEHPTFYALLYGAVEPGRPCAVTAPARAMLAQLLTAAARRGMLRMPPADAADQVLAANVGVTLSLIAQPPEARDLGLSDRVREAALAGVLAGPQEASAARPRGEPSVASAALTLRALLEGDARGLSAGEATLLAELLDRLGAAESPS